MFKQFTIRHFLKKFCASSFEERTIAVRKLCRAIAHGHPESREYQSALALLDELFEHLVIEERLIVAKHLSGCSNAPQTIVLALLEDVEEISDYVLATYRYVTDDQIVDAFSRANTTLQVQIAQRTDISEELGEFLARHIEFLGAVALVTNPGASLTPQAIEILTGRFEENEEMCEILLSRHDLPMEQKQLLVAAMARHLTAYAINPDMSPRFRQVRLAQASQLATLHYSSSLSMDKLQQMMVHLLQTEQLTPSVLVRAICGGYQVFFVEALALLSDRPAKSIAIMLRQHNWAAFHSLCEEMQLGERVYQVLSFALEILADTHKLTINRTLRSMSSTELDWLIHKLNMHPEQEFGEFVVLLRMMVTELEANSHTAESTAA